MPRTDTLRRDGFQVVDYWLREQFLGSKSLDPRGRRLGAKSWPCVQQVPPESIMGEGLSQHVRLHVPWPLQSRVQSLAASERHSHSVDPSEHGQQSNFRCKYFIMAERGRNRNIRDPVGTASARDLIQPHVPDDICLTVIVLGASGDLAKKKTFPALYTLFYRRSVCPADGGVE